jgi:predicted anti-sigma-YlaC factor YlaD
LATALGNMIVMLAVNLSARPTRARLSGGLGRLTLLTLACCLGAGCSFKRMAVNKLGDALASGGTAFASDDDPELVKAAAPFSLKLMEGLLAESPRHQGLLFASASGFTQYAYAFVQQEAEELEERDFAAAEALKARARKLYLRARDYGLRGLEVSRPGFTEALRRTPREAVRAATRRDVRLLYWTAASWGAAISMSKDNPELIADQGIVESIIDRALELDETFDQGAIHSFLITYEMARPSAGAQAEERARRHFARAVELSKAQLAGPYVSLAEAVAVPKQNQAEFKALLEQALAVNPDARPESRLVNLVIQRRARWLLAKADDLFFEAKEK